MVLILSGIPVLSGVLGCQRTIRGHSSMKLVIYLAPGVVSTINYLYDCESNLMQETYISSKFLPPSMVI